jgi:hypothetical protein
MRPQKRFTDAGGVAQLSIPSETWVPVSRVSRKQRSPSVTDHSISLTRPTTTTPTLVTNAGCVNGKTRSHFRVYTGFCPPIPETADLDDSFGVSTLSE